MNTKPRVSENSTEKLCLPFAQRGADPPCRGTQHLRLGTHARVRTERRPDPINLSPTPPRPLVHLHVNADRKANVDLITGIMSLYVMLARFFFRMLVNPALTAVKNATKVTSDLLRLAPRCGEGGSQGSPRGGKRAP